MISKIREKIKNRKLQNELNTEFLTDLHNSYIKQWHNIISETVGLYIKDLELNYEFFEYSRFLLKFKPVYYLVLGSSRYYNEVIADILTDNRYYLGILNNGEYITSNNKTKSFFEYVVQKINNFNKEQSLNDIVSCELIRDIDSYHITLVINKEKLVKYLGENKNEKR